MSNNSQVSADLKHVVDMYADALLNVGARRGETNALIEELEGIVGLLDRMPRFDAFVASPVISSHDKLASLRRMFEGRVADSTLGMLSVLCQHQRLGLLRGLVAECRAKRDEQLGRRAVAVSTAAPLSDEQQQTVRTRLTGVLNVEPLTEFRVDPALVGGLVIRVGDTVVDGSVRTRLRRLRKQIMARSTHEIQSG